MRNVALRVFQQRIKLEADIAVVTLSLLPNGQKDRLGLTNELVGKLPGDFVIAEALVEKLLELLVEATGADQVGNDDRIAGGACRAGRAVLAHEVRVDRIE